MATGCYKARLHKFAGSCLPGIFAGSRLENGCRFRGVVLVLDYEKLRTQAPGFEHTVALPQEEVVFDDHLTMPLKASHRQSLAGFKFEDLSKIPPITIPFSDECLELPAKTRAEYITLGRLIKYGGTDGCRGCEVLTSRHTKACRDRFNRLIKADKPVPVELKSKPVTAEEIQGSHESEPHVLASGNLVGPRPLFRYALQIAMSILQGQLQELQLVVLKLSLDSVTTDVEWIV